MVDMKQLSRKQRREVNAKLRIGMKEIVLKNTDSMIRDMNSQTAQECLAGDTTFEEFISLEGQAYYKILSDAFTKICKELTDKMPLANGKTIEGQSIDIVRSVGREVARELSEKYQMSIECNL